MPVEAGSHLGPYEILSAIGAGGMGEVYRARDRRLNRDVALKVLPDLFANDPERLARFQREAHVLASLNHPNIAKLPHLEAAAGPDYVMAAPTITSPAMMTGVGVLLGTAAYMSPEQAKGREADKRSDIWAFGCVLYEMLSGTRPFD